jgi:hypothetical protein
MTSTQMTSIKKEKHIRKASLNGIQTCNFISLLRSFDYGVYNPTSRRARRDAAFHLGSNNSCIAEANIFRGSAVGSGVGFLV